MTSALLVHFQAPPPLLTLTGAHPHPKIWEHPPPPLGGLDSLHYQNYQYFYNYHVNIFSSVSLNLLWLSKSTWNWSFKAMHLFSNTLEDLIAHAMFALLEAIQLRLALASARVREWVWGNLISGNNNIDLSEINSPAKQPYLAYILPSFGSSNL